MRTALILSCLFLQTDLFSQKIFSKTTLIHYSSDSSNAFTKSSIIYYDTSGREIEKWTYSGNILYWVDSVFYNAKGKVVKKYDYYRAEYTNIRIDISDSSGAGLVNKTFQIENLTKDTAFWSYTSIEYKFNKDKSEKTKIVTQKNISNYSGEKSTAISKTKNIYKYDSLHNLIEYRDGRHDKNRHIYRYNNKRKMISEMLLHRKDTLSIFSIIYNENDSIIETIDDERDVSSYAEIEMEIEIGIHKTIYTYSNNLLSEKTWYLNGAETGKTAYKYTPSNLLLEEMRIYGNLKQPTIYKYEYDYY